MSDTIIWISGATQGIGLGLSPDARVTNISRQSNPACENFKQTCAASDSWDRSAEHFHRKLDAFHGKRAIFIHNAFYPGGIGFAGELDARRHRNAIVVNCSQLPGSSHHH